MSDVELRTIESQVISGDTIVHINRFQDGRTWPWRVSAKPATGLGAPIDQQLYADFRTENAAVRAATVLAVQYETARLLLCQANEQIYQARTDLIDAADKQDEAEEVTHDPSRGVGLAASGAGGNHPGSPPATKEATP